MRALLVESDSVVGRMVRDALRSGGYAVDWINNGNQALSAISNWPYNIVLLDIYLPEQDGLTVLRQLREQGHTIPVLVITGRAAVADRIAALDLGADDYLVKPFHFGEMMARVRVLSRRKTPGMGTILRNGELSIDQSTREVWFHGIPCHLSSREFSLLRELLRRPGSVLSRVELEERIYGWSEEVESNAVEFLIHRVRKKLDYGTIVNVRGAGWMVPKIN